MLDSSTVANAAASGAQTALSEIEAAGKNELSTLIEQFGRADVSGALSNILGTTFADLIKQVINDSPLPDFLKDAANDAIDGAVADERAVSTPEAEEATQSEMSKSINEDMGDAITEMLEAMTRAADEMMNEESQGGTESGVKGGGKGQAGGASNWLEALAKAMGDVAGQHLGKSVGLANEISALAAESGEETNQAQAQEMTALQAQMQAETQMFKLAQEAVTTIIKSVGEALTATARKQ